ncbi:MAG: hypothetical protein Q7S58_15255 [Candidatus Binatus sp.]|uniref:hypothetical protein n=1 Tax=Candidatus Binatus sp. TaxID=2811406 RepID=UPI00271EC01B|nr:hypothetical protein [Candidatus Binatus sp.]MDO8433759.1 hypothetical protein [Candidatus Binatus sp.]
MEKNVVSMVRPGARLFRAGVIAVSLAMLAMAGCASENATEPPAGEKPVAVNFALEKCQLLSPNLYKCPAVDQPICTPEFQRTDVSCVRIGPKGSVFVMRPGLGS